MVENQTTKPTTTDRNLPNLDALSLSDPIVIVTQRATSDPSSPWMEIGRTEMIKDNLNPTFVTPIRVSYRFETVQTIKFSCFDIDDPRGSPQSQDFEGEAITTLAEIIIDKSGQFRAPLKNPKIPSSKATIRVISEEVQDINDDVLFAFSLSLPSNFEKHSSRKTDKQQPSPQDDDRRQEPGQERLLREIW